MATHEICTLESRTRYFFEHSKPEVDADTHRDACVTPADHIGQKLARHRVVEQMHLESDVMTGYKHCLRWVQPPHFSLIIFVVASGGASQAKEFI